MADTTFLAKATKITSAWLQDVNDLVYRLLANAKTVVDARTVLDVYSKTETQAAFQPLDADLTAIAGLISAADRLPYFNGAGSAALAVFTSFARTLLDDANAETAQSTLLLNATGVNFTTLPNSSLFPVGLSRFYNDLGADGSWGHCLTIKNNTTRAIQLFVGDSETNLWVRNQSGEGTAWTAWNKIWSAGNDGAASGLDADLLDGQQGSYYQTADATLTALAGLVTAADTLPYFTGVDTAALATFTAFARTLLDDADAATALATLGAQPLDATLTSLAGGVIPEELTNTATSSLQVPAGTTAQRPAGADGKIRYNNSLSQYEGYKNGAWGVLGGGATGGAGNYVFHENDQAVTVDYTIPATKNAVSAGPITVNTGITVTVSSGAVWTIV